MIKDGKHLTVFAGDREYVIGENPVGQGVNNKMSVTYDSESKLFYLYINDYKVTSFSTSENITFKNSKSGFAVVIANNETFPSNPVKVTFKK